MKANIARNFLREMIVSRELVFQLEFHGPGQGMSQDWRLATSSLGRLSRGATVRMGGLGEVGDSIILIKTNS